MSSLLLRTLRRPPTLPRTPFPPKRWCSSRPTSSSPNPARTRFAPSPTGYLHLGSLRTALFNYLLAASTSGSFLLRIEDTDQKRTIPGAESSIYRTLHWAGLHPDESPKTQNQSHGPYRQSDRKLLHQEHAQKLLESGHAYRCFCPASRLTALSAARAKLGFPTDYDRTCYSIPKEESDARAAAGEQHVVRLLAPETYPDYTDLIYGLIKSSPNTRAHAHGAYEDPVLLKSDGNPTYHLANVVDDHHMEVTHVVRATEWMPSTPKHMFLYQCFGWKPPKWVHVGLLQDASRKKLSKRNGDVFVDEYRAKGYLPEALVNFVALLGWSHSEGNDVMDIPELVTVWRKAVEAAGEDGGVKGLTQGNTVVDFGKLDFLQKEHIRRRLAAGGPGAEEIVDSVDAAYREQPWADPAVTKDYIRAIVFANKNLTLPVQFIQDSKFFFVDPLSELQGAPSKEAAKLMRKVEKYLIDNGMKLEDLVQGLREGLEAIPAGEWTEVALGKVVECGEKEKKRWQMEMAAARLAITGGMSGPSLAKTLEILGKVRGVERVHRVGEWWGGVEV